MLFARVAWCALLTIEQLERRVAESLVCFADLQAQLQQIAELSGDLGCESIRLQATAAAKLAANMRSRLVAAITEEQG